MANNFVGVSIPDLPPLMKKIERLPSLVADEGTDKANDYILSVFRQYAPYRYVSRKSAYGKTFVSAKQRRYVMAMIGEGKITPGTPKRTQALAGGWRIIGAGVGSIVANEQVHAPYVQGNSKQEQSRHAKKIGWRGVDVLLEERAGQILRRFEAGVTRARKILGIR